MDAAGLDTMMLGELSIGGGNCGIGAYAVDYSLELLAYQNVRSNAHQHC